MKMKITPTSVCIYKPKQKIIKDDDRNFKKNWKSFIDSTKYGQQKTFSFDTTPQTDTCDSISDVKQDDRTSMAVRHRSMSTRTKRKIRNRMTYWYWQLKRKTHKPILTFWTLTLTSKQLHTDEQLNKMLNTFLTRLRNIKKFEYLWVSEIQTKNTNNLHYHIVFDQPFEIQTINYYWCKILENNGYDVVCPKPYILDDFGQRVYLKKPTKDCKFDAKYCSNPVDTEYIYNMKGISRYMSKYVTKNNSKVGADMFHCSRMFSGLNTDILMEYNDNLFTEILTNNHYTDKQGNTHNYYPITIYQNNDENKPIGTFLYVVCTDYIEQIFEQNNCLN